MDRHATSPTSPTVILPNRKIDGQAEETTGKGALCESLDEGAGLLWAAMRDPVLTLLAGLVFLVPLLRVRALEDSFNTPKVTLLLVGAAVLCAMLVVRILRREQAAAGPMPDLFRLSLGVWMAFGLWHVASLAWASSSALAYSALIHGLGGLAVMVVSSRVVTDPRAAGLVLAAGALSAVLMAGWVLMEDGMAAAGITSLQRRLPDWRGYLSAGLGNSGHIAGWIGLFLFPILAAHSLMRRASTITYLAVLLCFAALVVTWSVGSTGSSLLALGVWLVVAQRNRVLGGLRGGRVVGVLAIGLVALSFYFIPHPANPHNPSLLTKAFSSQRWKDGLPTRQAIYETTLEMVRNRLMLGWGAGNFTLHYVQQKPVAVTANPQLAPYAGSYTNDAHNDLLQVVAETGLVGGWLAVLATGLWIFGLAEALRRRPSVPGHRLALICCGCGSTVFLLDGLMSFPSRLPAHWMAFCVMQGMAMGLARDRAAGADDAEDQRPVPASRWIVPAILLGLCLVALPHQYRRVAAEWHLKSARTTADSALVMRSGVPGSMWDHLQFIQEEMVAAWASGKDGLLEALLEAGAQAAQTPVLQQVVRHLEQADKLAPRYTNASSRRSVVLMASGQWREAGDLLDRIMLDLQSPEILDRRAFCHVMTGGFQQAADLWTELAKRQPRAAERHMLLAARAAELGRTKNSADHAVREDTHGPAATPSTE